MHITHLEAAGIKGLTFAHDFGKKVLITGPNRSGKTTRIDAIRIGILGIAPEIGKKVAADTVGLFAGGTSMDISLAFDDERAIQRTFRLNGTGGITATHTNAEFADTLDCMLLNWADYFNGSDRDRVDRVFALAPDTGLTVEKILADLRGITLEENSEQTEKTRSELVETCRKALVLSGVNKGLEELTRIKTGILPAEFTNWNRRATDSLGAVKTLTELKNRSGECSAETVASLRKKMEAIKARGEEARTVKAGLDQRKATADKTAKRRAELDAILMKPFAAEAEIDVLVKRISERKIGDAQAAELALISARKFHEAAYATANEAERAVAMKEARLREEQAEKAEIDGMACCPKCEGKGKSWKAKMLAGVEKRIAEIEDELAAMRTDLATKARTESKFLTDLENAKKAISDICDAIRATESDTRGLKELQALRAAYSEAQKERATLTATEPPSEADLSAAEKELEGAIREYREMNASLDAALALERELQRAEEAHQEHQKARAYVKVLNAFKEALGETKADLVNKTFAGFMETANAIFGDVMESPLIFKDGNIGRLENGTFISHKTMSDSEKILTFVAISAALSAKSPFKIAVIGDMGCVDVDEKVKVLRAIGGAVDKGLLDQVIIADPIITRGEPIEDLPSGWQHIDLARGGVVAQDYIAA